MAADRADILAGRTSPLYKRHGVYIDVVTVADVPDNYDERLTTALDGLFEKRGRFREELRPKLGRPEREDLTLALWIEIIEETRQRRQG